MRKDQSVRSTLLRKLSSNTAIASAAAIGLFAIGASFTPANPLISPAQAQLYSEGYQFLEAVKERDGTAVTEALDKPGSQIVNSRDITSGDTGLHIVTERRDVVWVRFLLNRGANPNIRNKQGVTPLQLATRLGFIEGAEELVEKGAQVNVADDQGETPLIAAVHQRNVALVRQFLSEGANPDHNDNSGRSARDYVALMTNATLLEREFAEADAARENKGTQEQYGPSF